MEQQIQWVSDVTCARLSELAGKQWTQQQVAGGCTRWASGQPVNAVAYTAVDVKATILKVWHHIKIWLRRLMCNCVFTWRTVPSNFTRSNLKQWSFRLFWRAWSQQEHKNKKNNKMSSNMGSVPDLKIGSYFRLSRVSRDERCWSKTIGWMLFMFLNQQHWATVGKQSNMSVFRKHLLLQIIRSYVWDSFSLCLKARCIRLYWSGHQHWLLQISPPLMLRLPRAALSVPPYLMDTFLLASWLVLESCDL